MDTYILPVLYSLKPTCGTLIYRNNIRRKAAAKLMDSDIKDAVKLTASTEGFIGHGNDVINALKAKALPSLEDHSLSMPPNVNLPVVMNGTKEEITTAVNSFPLGSAAGPDG